MGLQVAVHLGHMPWALTKEEEEEEEWHHLPQHPGVHLTHHMMPRTMRIGASGKASELYSGNTQLESRPEHELA
jgi:hypothetical protein